MEGCRLKNPSTSQLLGGIVMRVSYGSSSAPFVLDITQPGSVGLDPDGCVNTASSLDSVSRLYSKRAASLDADASDVIGFN